MASTKPRPSPLDYAIWDVLEKKQPLLPIPRNGIKCLKNLFEGMQIISKAC